MPHFLEEYAESLNDILHDTLGGTLFYKQELIEVPGLLTGLVVTYDDVRDDIREVHDQLSWEAFVNRMSMVKADWNGLPTNSVSPEMPMFLHRLTWAVCIAVPAQLKCVL